MELSPYRDPLLAGMLAVLPGAGHWYAGRGTRGITFLMGTAVGLVLFVVPGVVIWAVSIPDAVACARRRNREAPPLRHASLPLVTDRPGPDTLSPPAETEPRTPGPSAGSPR